MTSDRKRTWQRILLAVSTFAVVAVVAGAITARVADSRGGTAEASPSTVEPVPSTSSSASPSPSETSTPAELPNRKSDTLDADEGGEYWVWAPPTAAGKRMLTMADDGSLNLSRSSKKPAADYPEFRGALALTPVGTDQYSITNLLHSEEANAFCVTVIEAGFYLEVCDEDDEKQAFTMTKVSGGYTIDSRTRGQYLLAEGREISWTDNPQQATVFAMEAAEA